MLYQELQADFIVAEANNGGEMVKHVVQTAARDLAPPSTSASCTPRAGSRRARNRSPRSTNRSALRHVGAFPELEDQMTTWVPGQKSPDRMDALVWLMTARARRRARHARRRGRTSAPGQAGRRLLRAGAVTHGQEPPSTGDPPARARDTRRSAGARASSPPRGRPTAACDGRPRRPWSILSSGRAASDRGRADGGAATPDSETGQVGTPGNLNVVRLPHRRGLQPGPRRLPMFPFYNKMRLGDAQVNATQLMMKLPLKGARGS
jgi:hypothetical protein